jgi:SAM-dependent methyltransferase
LSSARFLKDTPAIAALLSREHSQVRAQLSQLNPGPILWISSHSDALAVESDFTRPCFTLQLDKSESLIGAFSAASTLLPISDGSLSAIVLQHVLEFVDEPETLLAECARVLRGDGALILLGFRPFSPARLRSNFRHRAPRWVGSGTWTSVLRALGFRDFNKTRFGWLWPSVKASGAGLLKQAELALPSLNSAYNLTAKKRDVRLIFIGASQRRGLQLTPVSANASSTSGGG